MRRSRAMIELSIAALLFGLMAFLTRRATSSGVGASQVALLRFGLGATVVLGGSAAGVVHIERSRHDLLLLRGFLGSAAALLYFIALAHLPIGTTTLLHYSAPIWSTMLAAIFLRESPTRPTVLALALAACGVLLVVLGQGAALGGEFAWLALGVFSAALSGGAVVAVRAARRYNSAWTVFAAFTFIGVLFTAIPAIVEWVEMSPVQWLLCIAVGAVSVVAQILMTRGLGTVENVTAGILGLLTVVSAMALGYLFDRELLSGLSIVGATLTVVGIVIASRVSRGTSVK
jgi:drug/metabolite transporter (DMT)-like permease